MVTLHVVMFGFFWSDPLKVVVSRCLERVLCEEGKGIHEVLMLQHCQ